MKGQKFCEKVRLTNFIDNICKIVARVQEVRIEFGGFLEVMHGQPFLALSVEHASQAVPCDGEVRSLLDGYQIAMLGFVQSTKRFEEVSQVTLNAVHTLKVREKENLI
jgi:hypothetical protein